MSNIKNYFEDLSVIIATAIYEESKNSYYCRHLDYSKTEEKVMNEIFDGNIDDIFDEMYCDLSDCQWNKMHEQMPKTFMACTLLLPWLSDKFRNDHDLSSHSLYFDYNNQNILESASPEIVQMFLDAWSELDPYSFDLGEAQREITKNYDRWLTKETLESLEEDVSDVPESDRESIYPWTMVAIRKLHEIIG